MAESTPHDRVVQRKTDVASQLETQWRIQAHEQKIDRLLRVVFGDNGDVPSLPGQVRELITWKAGSLKWFQYLVTTILTALIAGLIGLFLKGNPVSDRETQALQIQVWQLQQELQRLKYPLAHPEGPR